MKPTFTMLIGLPASGKSTWVKDYVKEHKDKEIIICSSDSVRKELYGDESIQGDVNKVFNILNKRVVEYLKSGKDVIYDCTNIKRKTRLPLIDRIKKNVDCNINCVCIMTPYGVCLERNKSRKRVVPEEIIRKMLLNWQPPCQKEGFNKIDILLAKSAPKTAEISRNQPKSADFDYSISNFLKIADNFDQENSHHKLTLGEHCRKAAEYIDQIYPHYSEEQRVMYISALLHDNGKLVTKTRVNARGVDDGDCHYYQHHCVGAYNSFFYTEKLSILNMQQRLMISNLIYYHMHPYITWEQSEKSLKRDKEILGDKMFNLIQILHKADLYAH